MDLQTIQKVVMKTYITSLVQSQVLDKNVDKIKE